jgi:hypothetical protein
MLVKVFPLCFPLKQQIFDSLRRKIWTKLSTADLSEMGVKDSNGDVVSGLKRL